MTTRALQNSFVSGEVAPQLIGRTDDGGYRAGASKLENFIVLPQGAIRSRAGFQYVGVAKDSTKPVRLISFRFASDQTLILVFGEKTMRIITDGKEVLNSNGTVYEIATPFTAYELATLDYCQNGDVITFTSIQHVPVELIRYGALDWRFRNVSLTPNVYPPTNISVTARYANRLSEEEEKDKNKLTVRYVVTAVDTRGYESIASAEVSGTGNFYINGGTIRVQWNTVSGADHYKVYRYVAGLFGFVGQTADIYLDDMGDNPDTSETPPKFKSLFYSAGGTVESITVKNGGSGYHFGWSDTQTFLPNIINLKAIPPIGLGWVDSRTDTSDGESSTYYWYGFAAVTGVFLNVQDDTTKTVIKSIPLDYGTQYVTTGNSSPEYTYVYLKNTGSDHYIDIGSPSGGNTLTLSIMILAYGEKGNWLPSETCMGRPTSGSNITAFNADLTAAENFFKTNTSFRDKMVVYTVSDRYKWGNNGLLFNEWLSLFGAAANATCTIPLNIQSNSGLNATAYATSVGGVIRSATVTNKGVRYEDAGCYVSFGNTLIGSGAQFSVIIAQGVTADLPSTVTLFDQRRVFAGSTQNPLKVWMTNAGYQDLMMYHLPTLSDDRIEISAVASDADRIRHAVALESLLLFTGSAELRVYTQNSDALSPSSVAVRAQSFVGCNDCQPVVMNNQVVFAGNRGGHLYAMGYQNNAASYVAADISLRATHLFDGHNVVSLALSKSPIQILWVVLENGTLLSCTFYSDQGVIAWCEHTTDGAFEDVTTLTEGQEDHLYAVIKRGSTRYIERLEDITVNSDITSHRYLDCFSEGTFSTPTSAVTGLSYLEGKTVAVFADGKPQNNKVVSGGKITLDTPAKNVAVGLPYTCTLDTLPLIAQAEAAMQGRVKDISEVFLRVSYNGDIYANNLYAKKMYKVKKDDLYMKPHGDKGYVVKVSTDGNWDYDAQLKVEHRDCAPLEIEAVIANYSVEGGK